MGSGDDDEDEDGQEESITETENDRVYFSRGLCCIYWNSKIKCHKHICQENMVKLGFMIPLLLQAHTGPMFRGWRKSFMLSQLETRLNFAVRLQEAHCPQSAGWKMAENSEESTGLEESRWNGYNSIQQYSILTGHEQYGYLDTE